MLHGVSYVTSQGNHDPTALSSRRFSQMPMAQKRSKLIEGIAYLVIVALAAFIVLISF
jgi:hypothetical protein